MPPEQNGIQIRHEDFVYTRIKKFITRKEQHYMRRAITPPEAVKIKAGMLRWRGTMAALLLPNGFAAFAAPTGSTDCTELELATSVAV